jgi:hypothetical protein
MVNLTLTYTNYLQSNTRVELQDLVDVKTAAIIIIANYAGGATLVPILANYTDAEVIGVLAEDLNTMNAAILATNASTALTPRQKSKPSLRVSSALIQLHWRLLPIGTG